MLAQRSGLSLRTIWNLERGVCKPRHPTAKSLLEALGLTWHKHHLILFPERPGQGRSDFDAFMERMKAR